MKLSLHFTKDNQLEDNNWKENNKKYLRQLQKFLDVADSIENEDLKKAIITEMLKCDKILTEIAERRMSKLMQKNKK